MGLALFWIAIAVLCGNLFGVGKAFATDYGVVPTIETGPIWMFLYSNRWREDVADITLRYGAGLTLHLEPYVTAEWARNMALEANYFYSKSHVTVKPFRNTAIYQAETPNEYDLYVNTALLQISYFFSGRRLHPNLTIGGGATYMEFYRLNGVERTQRELQPTLVVGGGVDYTLAQLSGKFALDQINIGGRVRYCYYSWQHLVDESINSVDVGVRLSLRF